MERYLCVHAHFYQPPRENPWLEAIELQDSAYPYHDWNERITAECYGPNVASRILDDASRIVCIANNLEKISFNFGPTLLSWMKDKAPEGYEAILAADRKSRERFAGHGSALAQAYNHMILPLGNRRDKCTQVLWGIRDFEHRFGRAPEGMWLPETAVDLETLEVLAEAGIRFTVLAPNQAGRIRKVAPPDSRPSSEPVPEGRQADPDTEWLDVHGGRIDPTRVYLQKLPSGRGIHLFFYDGPISRAVAFEGLLANGGKFAERLLSGFSDERDWPQLFHIATDGETYGHHHRFGEMALAHALDHIESNKTARLTNYGEFLERHQATHEVEIVENTAWSCAHGVDRWRADCGCNTGRHGGWNQAWRGPLRAALDELRDTVAPLYEKTAGEFLRDPWAARDDYIHVVLDRSPSVVDEFLERHRRAGAGAPDEAARITALKLLELQRNAMLMYTSCGWFFDELSRIETVQVIQYAGRVIQLARELFGYDPEPRFVEALAEARSNVPEFGDGARIYERCVKPAIVNLEKVAAHYAISSLFEPYDDRSGIYCYTVEREDYHTLDAGKARLALGRARVTSEITRESGRFSFGVLHLGDHNLSGGVREFHDEETDREPLAEVREAFERADFAQVIRVLDKGFGPGVYSLQSLFRDGQRKIVDTLLNSTLSQAEAAYRQVYEHNAGLMRFLSDLGNPLPKVFHTTAEFVLNANLRRALEEQELNLERISALLQEARAQKVTLDAAGLSFALRTSVERMMAELLTDPANLAALQKLDSAAGLLRSLPFDVDLSRVQNMYYAILRESYPKIAASSDPMAQVWLRHFTPLGEKLSVRVAS